MTLLNLVKQWVAENGTNTGPYMRQNKQQLMANEMTQVKQKLYRGTVVNANTLKNKQCVQYSSSRLQSWTQNLNTATIYTLQRKTPGNSKVPVIFVGNTTDARVNGLDLQQVYKNYKVNNISTNKNIETVLNRPVYVAQFQNAVKHKDGVYHVPVKFLYSHNNIIVSNKKPTQTLLNKCLTYLKRKRNNQPTKPVKTVKI
jgi:hypothetical protein